MIKINQHSLDFMLRSSIPITLADPTLPDCPLIYVNECFEKAMGYSKEEILGKNCRFLQCPETSQEDIDQLRNAIQNLRSVTVCIRNQRKCGARFWNLLFLSPVDFEDGRVMIGCQYDLGRNPTHDRVEAHTEELSSVLHQANYHRSASMDAITKSMKVQALSIFTILQSKANIEQKIMPKSGMTTLK